MAQAYVNTRSAAYPGGVAVPGVHVSLHSNVVLASGSTDAQGMLLLGNVSAGTYELRITPPAGSLPVAGSRQSITVSANDPATIVFDVLIDQSVVTPPTDSRLCRCWGVFKDPSGRPYRDVTLTFNERVVPQLLRDTVTDVSTAVLPKYISVITDANGYASVDLIRDAQYSAMVGPLANTVIDIIVPNLPTASLPDVLFVVVDRVEYKLNNNTLTPTSAPALAVQNGSTTTLSMQTVYRSGYRVDGLSRVSLFVQDDDIIKVSLTTDGNLAIQAIAPGSAVIEVRRSETQEKTIYPEPNPKGSITVTVSP